MNLKLALVSASILAQASYGSTELGNGGDGIFCDTANEDLRGKKAMLLDYYEGDQFFNNPYDLGDEQLSVKEKVELVLNRLQKLDPDRVKRYKMAHQEFWNQVNISAFQHLPELPDEGPVELPASDCRIKQVAYHKEPELPGEKRYFIKKKLWEMLDNDSKAGVVLHEIIYREAVGEKHNNSRKSRYYNAAVSSKNVSDLDQSSYAAMLKTVVKLPAYLKHHGISLDLGSIERDDENHITKGWLAAKLNSNWQVSDSVQTYVLPVWNSDTAAQIEFHKERVASVTHVRQMWIRTPSYNFCFLKDSTSCVNSQPECTGMFLSELHFYEEGDLAHFNGCNPQKVIWVTSLGDRVEVIPGSKTYDFYFHPGMIWKGGVATAIEGSLPTTAQGTRVRFLDGSKVEIDSAGFLRQLTLGNEYELPLADGGSKVFPQGSQIHLDESGLVIE